MKPALLSAVFIIFTSLAASPQGPTKPLVGRAVYFDVSPPLREMALKQPERTDQTWKEGFVKNFFRVGEGNSESGNQTTDGVKQSFHGSLKSDTTLVNFDGLNNINNVVPPDTYGDVGPSHYFGLVNLSFAIYDRQGVRLLGPLNTSTIWQGLPHNFNNGDAVVLYDEQADRWLISQFSFPTFPDAPFYQMVAVSQTGDPTGTWYRWEFSFNELPDYPKFGVWGDGYYMSYTRIKSGTIQWAGIGAIAFNRDEMLQGKPDPRFIHFMLPQLDSPVSLLPADCDGPLPPSGTPCYFAYIYANDLFIRAFHSNWADPPASTFGVPFPMHVSPYSNQSSGIPQKDSDKLLSPLNDRLMYRLQFRDFGTYQSMVVNHTVNAGPLVGVRWYEFRKTTGDWFIRQQSTFAPDTLNRWMGSIAMDAAGNIALGYSVSAASVYPSVRITGRMKNDPLGVMTINEMTLINGTGSQTGIWSDQSRWGDYSSMTVDPVEPSRFWYTQEYYKTTSVNSWWTRIASFSFADILSIEAMASPDAVCDTGTIRLNVDVSGGSGTCDYLWSSDPPGFSSTLKSPVASPLISTRYIVEVTSGSQIRHDTVLVSVIPSPESYAGKDTSVCRYIDALPLSGEASNNISVLWSSSGDGLFDDPSSLITNYHPGSIDRSTGQAQLMLTAFPQGPCAPVSSTMTLVIDSCTGITENDPDAVLVKLYPNPAEEVVTAEISGWTGTEVSLVILDIKGTLVHSEIVKSVTRLLVRNFSLAGFPKGMLFLKVGTMRGWVVRPFVVR